MNDLRLRMLSPYRGFVFRWRLWAQLSPDWDHDHCKGCWARFAAQPELYSDVVYKEGWVTLWPTDPDPPEEQLNTPGSGVRFIPSPKPGGYQLDWLCPECFETYR